MSPVRRLVLRPAVLSLLLSSLLLPAGGCKSGANANPILHQSAKEALSQGKQLMADKKYSRAREYLQHAFEVEPNSLAGREGLLLVADSYYLDSGRTNLIQAEAKYRDYLNRFPTSDRAAYVQFQIGNSLAQRMGPPDRDLSVSKDALKAYEDLLRLYPTSEYAAQAREKMRLVRENLADHEYIVGSFYLTYKVPRAAVKRFDYLLENFPDYSERDKVLYKLGIAQIRGHENADAKKTFDRLAREYPDSHYTHEIPDVPPPKAAPATAGDGKKGSKGDEVTKSGEEASG